MKGDLYPQFPTLNQRQIGEHFGVSSHVVGRWLAECGLRDAGVPSPAAIDAGFVEQVDPGDGRRPFFAWRKKTVDHLESLGHMRAPVPAEEPVSTTRLTGPFTGRRSGGEGFEIVDGNGLVGVWVRGEENANTLVKLMNLGHEHRGLWP